MRLVGLLPQLACSVGVFGLCLISPLPAALAQQPDAQTSLAQTTLAQPPIAQQQMLQSPDGSIQIVLEATANDVTWSVMRKGEQVLRPSLLGLNLAKPARFGAMAIEGVTQDQHDSTYPLIATKAASARDHYNQLVVRLRERAGTKRALHIILRAYDDGVAFRYLIPQQAGMEQVEIDNERTIFALQPDAQCWALNVGNYYSSHEGEFDPFRVSQFRNHHLFQMPISCRSASGKTHFALTEADLRDYAGLYLRGRGDGLPGLEARLSPLPGEPRVSVKRTNGPQGIASPWRVVMMGDVAGKLIESHLISNLNPPNAIADTSWIVPGKSAWDWWSGPWLPPPEQAGTDMATYKRYIDFARDMGFSYFMVDEGWSVNSGVAGSTPVGADVTRAKPGVDMPELVAYARERGVGLILWVQWSLLDKQFDAALKQYQDWGIKGIKVDFMDRNDQLMVDFYHRLMQASAEHRLLVDMHGAYPPTGLNRTWPNFLTQEGVMGAEYNKWSARVTARHNVTLPYTRMLLGPMDYTPGGMRNVRPEEFRSVFRPPVVQTTRGQGLAMMVVYDSPLQMVSDSPDAYDGAQGREFLVDVPAAWDETRFITGQIGEGIVLARRKGRDWYVGAMTNEAARLYRFKLDFLGPGQFRADIWQDGKLPTELVRSQRVGLRALDQLGLQLAGSGGAVVKLSPQ